MKVYETLHLVKGEDLNHHGTLFAARAAAWLVEAAFAAAACEKGESEGLVCRQLHQMSFFRPVQKGSVVRLKSRIVYVGKTSLMAAVEFADAMSGETAVEGFVTFVTIEASTGRKKAHGMVLDTPEDEAEQALRERAEAVRAGSRSALPITASEAGQENSEQGTVSEEAASDSVKQSAEAASDSVKQSAEAASDNRKQPVLISELRVNEDPAELLKRVECFALDMDGTIYLGEQWIDGAKEFLAKIEASGRRYVFLTNNSSKNPGVYVEKLKRMGLEAGMDKIITSGQAAIYYLKKAFPGKRVFLLGNPMLREEFEQEGICLDEEQPEVVVTAFDTTLDYAKMCRVCDFVRAGLPYLSTHPDYNCPTETGFIPDAGAIHAFIHASAGRYPDRIIGKPNADIVDYLIERIGTEREKVAMVGDRLYTDIAAGKNNGLKSVLVLSGEATKEDAAASQVKPDLIFDSVKEMSAFL